MSSIALTAATKFTAVDKMSSKFAKMKNSSARFTDKMKTGMMKAERRIKRVGMAASNLSSKLFNLRNAAIAVGAGIAIKKIYDLGSSVAAMGDEVAKTSRRLGVSAEFLQEFKFAADRAGVSGEETVKSMEKLNKNVGDLRASTGSLKTILDKTNPTLAKQLKHVTTNEEAFTLITKAINKMPSQLDKAALAQAAFGRGGLKMLTVMEGGVEGLNKLRAEARKYGGVMSNEAAKAGEDFIDAQTNMKFALTGLKNTIGIGLMPVIKDLMERLTAWIGNNKELIKQKVSVIIDKIAKGAIFLANNIDKIGLALKMMVGLWVTFKAVTAAATIAQWALNASYYAFEAAAAIATAAQWAWNAALAANPIGLIVAGVIATIAGIAFLIIHWDEAVVKFELGINRWVAGFARVGLSIMEFVYPPIKKVLELIALIPGKIGEAAKKGMKAYELNMNRMTIIEQKALNAEKDNEKRLSALVNKSESKKDKLEIQLSADPGTKANVLENTGIPINMSNNVGWSCQ